MITYGKAVSSGIGASHAPELFGDGSDGDLYIVAGETVTLPVTAPYQSVVEKKYKNITIEAGGVLKCDANNAGLVLRCQGNCTINGTVDQSLKSPKPNPNNNYDYPDELACGAGGKGAKLSTLADAPGMPSTKYGGGWSGGGSGDSTRCAKGGSADTITIDTPDSQLFLGGAGAYYDSTVKAATPGINGGGGGGGRGSQGIGGKGGSGPAGAGANGNIGSGGGAGNFGGGVFILYVGGNILVQGLISCKGGDGGRAGMNTNGGSSYGTYAYSGGGAGGGAIYIVHFGEIINTGAMNVNGGGIGSPGKTDGGSAGGIGSITIKQWAKGMKK